MKRQLHAFDFQQFHLPMHPAGEAGEAAAGANDAMARDDHGNGIGPASAAYGAGGLGAADSTGEFTIAARTAGGDAQQRTPSLLLESSAGGEIQRRQDCWCFADEYGFERGGGLAQPIFWWLDGTGDGFRLGLWKLQTREAERGELYAEFSEWGVYKRGGHVATLTGADGVASQFTTAG